MARQKYSPFTPDALENFLHDPACLRHPTRLVFEYGNVALHQFAEPDIDFRNEAEDGRVLYLRPLLRDRPDMVRLAVAYMVPVINYGDIIDDSHCLRYGAALLGMMEGEFYQAICDLAVLVGAETKYPGEGCEVAACKAG